MCSSDLPAVLVNTPGSDKDVVADGHHHVLAALAEHEPGVWAYVATVQDKTGGWNQMGSREKR